MNDSYFKPNLLCIAIDLICTSSVVMVTVCIVHGTHCDIDDWCLCVRMYVCAYVCMCVCVCWCLSAKLWKMLNMDCGPSHCSERKWRNSKTVQEIRSE